MPRLDRTRSEFRPVMSFARMAGLYRKVKKTFDGMFSRFDIINECNGQDRRTLGRAIGRAMHSVARHKWALKPCSERQETP